MSRHSFFSLQTLIPFPAMANTKQVWIRNELQTLSYHRYTNSGLHKEVQDCCAQQTGFIQGEDIYLYTYHIQHVQVVCIIQEAFIFLSGKVQ